MLKIEWSLPAIGDLKSAGEYIAEDNPEATTRMAARILESVEYLIDQPHIGRPGRLAETKELVVSGTPFVIVYWLKRGVIQVLRVLHHARRWP